MKILITGAAGFIGTYLSKELRRVGHHVTGVDLEDGDLCTPTTAYCIISQHQPDIVIHLAAKVGRLFGEENPYVTITSNALATTHVALACRDLGVRLVYASTSEAFGDNAHRSVDETEHGVLPHNLYGLTKRWGEEAARLYAGKDLQILRFSMPYGPGLPAGRGRAAIITFLWQAHRHKTMNVHRGGRRSLCWIGDLTAGTRMIIESGESGVWTVGRDDNEVTIIDVAKMACSMAGASSKLIREIDPPQNQTLVKRLNVERLRGLGWSPRVELIDGMARTFEMVKQYDENGTPPKYWRELIEKEVIL